LNGRTDNFEPITKCSYFLGRKFSYANSSRRDSVFRPRI